MATNAQPAAYYAQFTCRFSGRRESFTKQLSAFAWLWAQTMQGVVGLERHAETFLDTTGQLPKERSFTLKLIHDDGSAVLWQAVLPGHRSKLALYEAAAKGRGLDFAPFEYATAYAEPGELTNRRLAQRVLAHAYGKEPSPADLTAIADHLEREYLTVEEVATAAQLALSDALLGCVSLWIQGRSKGDPTTSVGPKWRVRS